MDYPAPVARLIDELRKLPGIGPKSAQRIAFHLMRGSRDDATRLSEAVGTLLDGIRTCSRCHAITDQELCAICSHPARSAKVGQLSDQRGVTRSGVVHPRQQLVVHLAHGELAGKAVQDFVDAVPVLLTRPPHWSHLPLAPAASP